MFKLSQDTSDDEESMAHSEERKVYDGAHTFNINSVSFNPDGELFLTGDDLRINLWNLEISNESYSIGLIFSFNTISSY